MELLRVPRASATGAPHVNVSVVRTSGPVQRRQFERRTDGGRSSRGPGEAGTRRRAEQVHRPRPPFPAKHASAEAPAEPGGAATPARQPAPTPPPLRAVVLLPARRRRRRAQFPAEEFQRSQAEVVLVRGVSVGRGVRIEDDAA